MCRLLTTTHEPQPVIMVFIMGGILFFTAWFQALMCELLIDYVHVYYLFLFGIFYGCMERTKKIHKTCLPYCSSSLRL